MKEEAGQIGPFVNPEIAASSSVRGSGDRSSYDTQYCPHFE
jgi:hypothetical protein